MANGNNVIGILGAGPAGLAAAYKLANKNRNLLVIEKESEVGGLAKTFKKNGFMYDVGPHHLHPSKPEIIKFLQDILKKDLIDNTPTCEIVFFGSTIKYPIKGVQAITRLPKRWAFKAIIDFIKARFCMFVGSPKNDDSFKSWVINRFGKTMYKFYFGPYAEKAWKIPAEEISAYVGKKRVPIISITDYIRTLLRMRPKYTHAEGNEIKGNYYPRHGSGQLIDSMRDFITKNGASSIELNSDIKKIFHDGGRVKSICYEKKGVEYNRDVDFLFSTIPLNDLIPLFSPSVPPEVLNAASKLDFCSERLLFIEFGSTINMNVAFTYIQDPKVLFNRIFDLGRTYKESVPTGKNMFCVEFTCSFDDDIWNKSDEYLLKYVSDVLSKIIKIDENDIEGCFSLYVKHAYPRFRVGFEDNIKNVLQYLGGIENFITYGRQGLFAYANVDQVLDMGFKAADAYHMKKRASIDYYKMFEEYF